MPRLFKTSLESIPAGSPYIFADEALVEDWKNRLTEPTGLMVGISWQGSTTYFGDQFRSIPLQQFGVIARIPDVNLISLQKGDGLEQLETLEDPFDVLDFGDTLDRQAGPFMDSAALMLNLDLVITSDTAIAHVAGALGVPVWLALRVTPDWRWLLDREDSPWYPTMRLFRQTELGDWDSVFQRMATAVRRLTSP